MGYIKSKIGKHKFAKGEGISLNNEKTFKFRCTFIVDVCLQFESVTLGNGYNPLLLFCQ